MKEYKYEMQDPSLFDDISVSLNPYDSSANKIVLSLVPRTNKQKVLACLRHAENELQKFGITSDNYRISDSSIPQFDSDQMKHTSLITIKGADKFRGIVDLFYNSIVPAGKCISDSDRADINDNIRAVEKYLQLSNKFGLDVTAAQRDTLIFVVDAYLESLIDVAKSFSDILPILSHVSHTYSLSSERYFQNLGKLHGFDNTSMYDFIESCKALNKIITGNGDLEATFLQQGINIPLISEQRLIIIEEMQKRFEKKFPKLTRNIDVFDEFYIDLALKQLINNTREANNFRDKSDFGNCSGLEFVLNTLKMEKEGALFCHNSYPDNVYCLFGNKALVPFCKNSELTNKHLKEYGLSELPVSREDLKIHINTLNAEKIIGAIDNDPTIQKSATKSKEIEKSNDWTELSSSKKGNTKRFIDELNKERLKNTSKSWEL